jgi:ABC-2 type transport system ATP-binding protein
MRSLVAREGASVLWATHLIDEVASSDDMVVLHKGRVLAHGPVARVVTEAGASDIRGAFARLTKISLADTADEAA